MQHQLDGYVVLQDAGKAQEAAKQHRPTHSRTQVITTVCRMRGRFLTVALLAKTVSLIRLNEAMKHIQPEHQELPELQTCGN